jgi:hypothetical protein
MPIRLNSLFVVCLFFCSVAAMHGQASNFEEGVYTDYWGGPGCSNSSTTKLAISCSSSWDSGGATGTAVVNAQNGYGTMRFYGFSSITIYEQNFSGLDEGAGSEAVVDYLSILGLTQQPIAFLNLLFECQQCAEYANYAVAEYSASVMPGYYSCLIPTPPQNNPLCKLHIPIVYNQNTGQPNAVAMERGLAIDARTTVVNGPAGATVTTTVCIGYLAGGCDRSGATVRASVVDAKGKVIPGVTVVGSSGRIYN